MMRCEAEFKHLAAAVVLPLTVSAVVGGTSDGALVGGEQ